MKKLELAYSHSESTLVQSPRYSAFLSCFTDSGWEVVCVTPTKHVDEDELRRHGEEFIAVPTARVVVGLPSGKKLTVSLSKKGCYYV
jgi:hypothetical protein